MSGYRKQEILLETGTNEMEIIEFYLGVQPFGINVHKLKEIITFDQDALTVIPGSGPGMLGTLLLRGATIPLIDLKSHIGHKEAESQGEVRQVVLVCEFNDRVNGFKVDGVNQIHRVSWEDVQPMANFIDQYRPRFTGSVNIEGREILIVDLEHIVAEFDPEANLDYEADLHADEMLEKRPHTRERMKLVMAEDSALIRSGIEKVLTGAHYTDLKVFVDGQQCYDYIQGIRQRVIDGEPLEELLNLLISDIEMPKMDGLTLCKKIKEDPLLRDVKVVMFSSLINEQMAAKCDQVGADGYATKPQIPYLVEMMDEFLEVDKLEEAP
ncbi:two-component system, chemotaxis family, response regulator CheV [Desulfuromusa kysingii]|uniref:Two-component system, chemotaxis family, response regulator CheV n=1 Tax=Desulfuromusa kysingii TaxID=37625 RepID=A0A1H3XS38_9BACT|nr:chemotaxis protein [Desulfuromusa kysingii]SEA01328.1 two-component system, chemotaxis family, response regulator CheV [Desulfuromusa kysingii]